MFSYEKQSSTPIEPKFTFMKFIPTPEDGNQLGIAEVRINGPVRVLMRYKWMLTKEGKGTFPASASVCITKDTQKKYLECAQCDSSSDSEDLKEFIREHVKHYLTPTAQVNHATPPAQAAPQGVSANEQLPF